MISYSDFLLWGLVLGGAIFFWTHMQVRERAQSLAKQYCRQKQAQMLDGTVALKKMKLVRGTGGSLVWQRQFGFEFTMGGSERREGVIFLRGRVLEYVQMDLPENSEISMH